MVRTDELSCGIGAEVLFPTSSLHRSQRSLSTVCARNMRTRKPVPSLRKRRKLLSKTFLLLLKKVQVFC